MDIYVAADHNGLELKNKLREWLRAEGHEVVDVGAEQFSKADDYPDFAISLGEAVAKDPDNRLGIAVCGSGVGMAVAAGKVGGVRAGLIHDPNIAAAARRDDNVNVLALGAQYIDEPQARAVVQAWLEADFSGEERHVRRINKIRHFEDAGR